jgi:Ca2+-binding EF-hand superfamily protein
MNKIFKPMTRGLAAVLAGCLLGFAAHAGEGHGHGPAPFSDFDVDGNGSISEAEFNSMREQRMAARAAEGRKMRCATEAPSFKDIDTNADGQLNPEELAAGQKSHMEKCRAMSHGGKEGGRHMPAFADFDVDGNGMISEEELNAAHARRMSQMAEQGHEMRHKGAGPDFSSIDSNGDGGISEQEFTAHVGAHHKQMQEDANKTDR